MMDDEDPDECSSCGCTGIYWGDIVDGFCVECREKYGLDDDEEDE